MACVVACAWLMASSHCLLACFLPAADAIASGHEHCASQEAPAEQEEGRGCDAQNCCKALAAPTPLAKNLVDCDATSFIIEDPLRTDRDVLREDHDAPIWELDTGPPHRRTFAESVLQRSLLAHAPPALA